MYLMKVTKYISRGEYTSAYTTREGLIVRRVYNESRACGVIDRKNSNNHDDARASRGNNAAIER